MIRDYFLKLETHDTKRPIELTEVIEQLAFNQQGLIPVITQDATSHAVLMMAWMNKDAVLQTLATKRMTYWSRSRNELWVKGKTSGHIQSLVSMSFDCDGDAVLCQVNQVGAACHTGRKDCFYLNVDIENEQINVSNDTPAH